MTAAYLRGPSVQPVRLEACLTALSLTDAVRAARAAVKPSQAYRCDRCGHWHVRGTIKGTEA